MKVLIVLLILIFSLNNFAKANSNDVGIIVPKVIKDIIENDPSGMTICIYPDSFVESQFFEWAILNKVSYEALASKSASESFKNMRLGRCDAYPNIISELEKNRLTNPERWWVFSLANLGKKTNDDSKNKKIKISNNQAEIENDGAYCINRALRQRSLNTKNKLCPSGFEKISKKEFNSFPNLPIINKDKIKVSNLDGSNNNKILNSKKVTTQNIVLNKEALKKELKYWKELFEDQLITKAEYDAKRKELLNQPITKTKVKSNNSINNSNKTEKVIKSVSIDKSYQNKNYLYEKIDRKLFPMPTDRIFKNCNKDYQKILEQIKCSKDNLRATHRYKKRLRYFDIYELHVTTLDTIEDLILKGQLTEIQAKSNVASLNTQTINILDNRAELNRQKYERIGKLGQQLADPNYDITTGTYKNQNNNNTFQNQNNQSCMYNPATDYYQICLHKGAEQNSCFHFGNQCTP